MIRHRYPPPPHHHHHHYQVNLGVGMSIGSVPPNSQVNCVRNVTFDNIVFKAPIKVSSIPHSIQTTNYQLISRSRSLSLSRCISLCRQSTSKPILAILAPASSTRSHTKTSKPMVACGIQSLLDHNKNANRVGEASTVVFLVLLQCSC
jgi:hypothetical protein